MHEFILEPCSCSLKATELQKPENYDMCEEYAELLRAFPGSTVRKVPPVLLVRRVSRESPVQMVQMVQSVHKAPPEQMVQRVHKVLRG